LGQLERFSGTFVGATNLRESLDLAVFRRFDFKVGFDYLKQEQAWLLFKAIAEKMKVSFHPSEAEQLKARLAHLHHLTPWDCAVIQRKSLMVEKKPTADLLLTWLEQEVSSKPVLKKGLVGC
jgi:SpoVK/Ycf46/Vps4 family AAA+-type ATPase